MSLQACFPFSGSFTGANGAGAITLTGAKVGDVVLNVSTGASNSNGYVGSFEQTISVANQIQQIAPDDLTGSTFRVFLLRPIATC